MTLSTRAWPVVIAASAVLAGLMTVTQDDSAVREIVVLWFLAVCPGMAIVHTLGLGEPAVELTLAVALSLTLDTLVAMAMLYAGLWSPEGTLAILILASLVGAWVQWLTLTQRSIAY